MLFVELFKRVVIILLVTGIAYVLMLSEYLFLLSLPLLLLVLLPLLF